MMIVDSQVHIWAADTPERPWPKETPVPPHDGPLSAAQLRMAMAEAGVERAVLVPPSWEGTRNDVVLAAAAEAPERFAAMGRLDITVPDAPDRIRTWLTQPGMLGLRMNFWFDPLRSWLIDGRADWLFAALERHGIPMMVLATTVLPEMGRIAERHPGLRMVIDHLGMVLGNKGEAAFAEEAELLPLARLPNVAVKASATPVSATDGYPYRSVHVHLRRAFDAFGPDRFFWGTDLTQLPCSYKQAVSMFTQELPWLNGTALERVMGQGLCTWLGWP
jgi:L-fuconolactonase